MQSYKNGKYKHFIAALMLLTGMGWQARAVEIARVTPVGRAVGIRMTSEGVMVINIIGVQTGEGEVYPAQSAGLQVGDVILTADDIAIDSNETLQQTIEKTKTGVVHLSVKRGGSTSTLTVQTATDVTGIPRLGVMVRDSIAGIGTITFIDPQTNEFASLGHGICDAETNVLLPLATGNIMEANITNVLKGAAGQPGELQGEFNLFENAGKLTQNTASGVFGVMQDTRYSQDLKTFPLVTMDEVQLGSAQILSNVSGKSTQLYSVEITKLFDETDEAGRGMMLEVTDEKLLNQTGGIVQGMSGSPILQNGKLIGAVTHVLVNDPTKGYGIFSERMYQEMKAS